MKFYRVSVVAGDQTHCGYEWFTSKADAEACARDAEINHPGGSTEIDVIEITPTKRGILHALNGHAGYPNNG